MKKWKKERKRQRKEKEKHEYINKIKSFLYRNDEEEFQKLLRNVTHPQLVFTTKREIILFFF